MTATTPMRVARALAMTDDRPGRDLEAIRTRAERCRRRFNKHPVAEPEVFALCRDIEALCVEVERLRAATGRLAAACREAAVQCAAVGEPCGRCADLRDALAATESTP